MYNSIDYDPLERELPNNILPSKSDNGNQTAPPIATVPGPSQLFPPSESQDLLRFLDHFDWNAPGPLLPMGDSFRPLRPSRTETADASQRPRVSRSEDFHFTNSNGIGSDDMRQQQGGPLSPVEPIGEVFSAGKKKKKRPRQPELGASPYLTFPVPSQASVAPHQPGGGGSFYPTNGFGLQGAQLLQSPSDADAINPSYIHPEPFTTHLTRQSSSLQGQWDTGPASTEVNNLYPPDYARHWLGGERRTVPRGHRYKPIRVPKARGEWEPANSSAGRHSDGIHNEPATVPRSHRFNPIGIPNRTQAGSEAANSSANQYDGIHNEPVTVPRSHRFNPIGIPNQTHAGSEAANSSTGQYDDTHNGPVTVPRSRRFNPIGIPNRTHAGSEVGQHIVYPPASGTLSLSESVLEHRAHVATQTRHILENPALCRALLRSRGPDAQVLLNVFQWVLDDPDLVEDFRRQLIVSTQRLSIKSGLYPICYELKGVVQDSQDPVTGGGFADIYKGSFGGQVVCLKTLRVYQESQLEHILKQFSKEVILWGQLSHINVLPIYGLYQFKKRLCIVAPWMENGDIVTYLKLNPTTDRRSLASGTRSAVCAFDVAKGLWYLHKNSIIHGDLKGPNILIDGQGRACLCDFGIASICDPEIKAWTTQSSAASKGGSTRWQAPELFDVDSDEEVQNSVFSDIYAFGCVCYEIFTGKVPFYHITRDATVTLQVKSSKRPLRPEELDISWQKWGLTQHIWSLMEDCWKATPVERPTVDDLIERLAQLVGQDERSRSGSGSGPTPPTHFRRSISDPPNAASMASFDRICSAVLNSGS
ncbi:hypothetical protein DXG01_002913 [Tephrocybe rancida]|nr:hypothetical protein DXG01_002913 [Tephrocybe rancida]